MIWLVVSGQLEVSVTLVEVSVATPGREGLTTIGNGDIGARRAQALAIVTRRDETACGLGRRRR